MSPSSHFLPIGHSSCGSSGESVYSACKGGTIALSKTLAREMARTGITINTVCPGLIGTSFHDIFSKPEGRAAVAGNTPLRREGHPDEVADTIVYLETEATGLLTARLFGEHRFTPDEIVHASPNDGQLHRFDTDGVHRAGHEIIFRGSSFGFSGRSGAGR